MRIFAVEFMFMGEKQTTINTKHQQTILSNRMKKNLLFLLLPLALMMSMHSMAASQAGAAAIKAGNILHCFDWTFTDIQAELDNIKAAGFVTIQTSVAQKNYGGAQDWSAIYRPWDTSVGNGLGTANELKALCSAAHAKGMYIIVDVVANHTDGDGNGPKPYSGMADFWKNTDIYHNNGGANDGSRFQVTHGHIGMPDLKTEDSRVQAKYKEYVQALKGYGVDGIRWDAAKHIGLPSEGDQFWPSVIDNDMYNYGEILNTTGGNNTQCLKEYHNYMSVTDNQFSTNQVLGAFKSGNVPNNGGCWTFDTGSDKFVYWGESHDTYLNDGDASQNVDQSVIDRAYAIAAAFGNIPGLYLSRPNKPAKVGVKGSMNFKNSWVAEVNKMKNECVGQRSYYVSSNGVGAVLRESGAVIVKGSGSGQISINNGGSTLAAGTYTDHVTGNTFTVTSSSISGNIGQNGIAVLYEAQTPTPRASINPNGGSFTTETLSGTVTGQNCTSVWYKIGSGSKQTKTGKTATFTIGSGVNYGQTITVLYGASDGKTESSASATFTKKDASAVQKIYVKNAANWSTVYAYIYKDETTHVAGWPGTQMTAVSGSKCYDYEYTLPEGYENCYVIFTESSTATDHRYPADKQPGLTFSGTDMVFNNSTNGWAAYDPDNCGGDIKYEYKLDDETEYKEATEDILLEGLAVGSHTIVWQLTDQYSNKRPAACKTTIVVEDNTLPTCTGDVLEDVPTLVDAVTCDATVSLPLPTGAADNCSDNTLSYRYKVGKTGDYTDINKTTNITLPVGNNTIYWEMSDGINTHAEACSTVVTVLDKTAPYCDDLDMGKIKSDETDCNTDVLIELASGAKDYCNSKITYKYSVDGKELKTASAAPTLNLEVGTHEIVWTLADAKGNSRPDACKTTVTILGNQKLEPDCNTIAPHLYDTIKTCGPSTTVKIQAPTFTDPCYDDYIIKGTTKDNIKSFPLGNTVVTWTFTNKDKTQTAECQQTVSVVTSQKLQFECPKDTVKLALNADECVKEYTLVPKTATEPCTERELMGSAYINGKLVKPANYKREFPAGLTEIVWVFVGDANILAKPKDTCKQYVKVGNDNRPPVPCKNDKVSLTLDEGCDVLPTELDLGNEGVILADELCVAGKKVTPNIWRTSNPENVVHDPADLGVYHPGKDTVMWHYQFNPSNLGNIMDVYCVQPIEIFTDSKIKLDCNDESFAKLTFETPANTCQVPGDTVTLNPVDAVHPCFDDVIIEGKTDHDFTKPYPLGTTTITWVYTDHTWTLTDSVAQCTQLIEVIDKTKPTIVCDKDSTYYLPRDEKGQEALCAAPFADLDIKKPEVSDNCSSADEDFTISYVRKYTDEKGNSKTTAAEDPFEVGTTVITWTVLDKATNKSTCQQTIIVKDSITPKPTCPEDLTLEAPEGKCDTTIAVVVGETYKYEDPCEGDIIPVGVRDDGKEIGDPFPVMKLVTITWTYTDSHNNSSQCTQTVFVKDMTKPEVDCENTATPIKVKTELEKCEVDGEVVVDKITLPTAKDLCQEEAPVMTSSRYYLGRDGLAAPAIVLNEGDTVRWDDKTVPFKAGYYEIHFIFTDKAGNSDSCVQSVFVEDINPPVTDECKDVPTPVVLNPALGECDVNIVPTELNITAQIEYE